MSSKVAFLDEIGEHLLIERWHTEIYDAAHKDKAVNQIGRNDEVTETQRGKDHFAEGADVNHAGVGVESLQGSDGKALVTIFAVVVVFDDPCAGTVRPLDELQAA